MLLFISLSIQSGNFWIHPRMLLPSYYKNISVGTARISEAEITEAPFNTDLKVKL